MPRWAVWLCAEGGIKGGGRLSIWSKSTSCVWLFEYRVIWQTECVQESSSWMMSHLWPVLVMASSRRCCVTMTVHRAAAVTICGEQ